MKSYQFFINEKLKKISHFSPVLDPFMCLMKPPNYFEKIAILKIWQLVFFWGVKIHHGEKYAWFIIEILIYWSKILWSLKSRYNTKYIVSGGLGVGGGRINNALWGPQILSYNNNQRLLKPLVWPQRPRKVTDGKGKKIIGNHRWKF